MRVFTHVLRCAAPRCTAPHYPQCTTPHYTARVHARIHTCAHACTQVEVHESPACGVFTTGLSLHQVLQVPWCVVRGAWCVRACAHAYTCMHACGQRACMSVCMHSLHAPHVPHTPQAPMHAPYASMHAPHARTGRRCGAANQDGTAETLHWYTHVCARACPYVCTTPARTHTPLTKAFNTRHSCELNAFIAISQRYKVAVRSLFSLLNAVRRIAGLPCGGGLRSRSMPCRRAR